MVEDTGAQRVQRRRDKLRAAGLRLVQIRVSDTRASGFGDECARQARLVREREIAAASDDGAWAKISDTSG